MTRAPGLPQHLIAWLRARPVVADTLLALAWLVALMIIWVTTPPEWSPGPFLTALFWCATGLAPIAVRRRWLWVAVIAALLINLAAVFAQVRTPGTGVAVVVVSYTLASSRALPTALLGTAVLWLPPTALVLVRPELYPEMSQDAVGYITTVNALLALVIFFIGRTVHTRRRYVSALEERAGTAEANQRALAAQAVADERRRIARELHDVVAHHVSVMGVLATGARRTGRSDPKGAEAALTSIEESGRSAMRELRRILDVLRAEGEPAELTPPPGLAGVRAMVDQIRDTGLPVSLRIEGDEPADLDPGIALAIYRIVQEALTNTIKHAGRASAEVRVSFGVDELSVEVTDDGQGPGRPPGLGHGLVGMRERIALYGGYLRTGPRPGGGFRVYATLPIDAVLPPDGQRGGGAQTTADQRAASRGAR